MMLPSTEMLIHLLQVEDSRELTDGEKRVITTYMDEQEKLKLEWVERAKKAERTLAHQ